MIWVTVKKVPVQTRLRIPTTAFTAMVVTMAIAISIEVLRPMVVSNVAHFYTQYDIGLEWLLERRDRSTISIFAKRRILFVVDRYVRS